MNLPESLQTGIEAELGRVGVRELTEAHEQLSERYRQQVRPTRSFMKQQTEHCAYLAARMPATYSALCHVFEELRHRIPDIQLSRLLDLGAGPGSAMWAALSTFPEIAHVTLYERDLGLVEIGKRLGNHSTIAAIEQADWRIQDLEKPFTPEKHDLTVLSYSAGELTSVGRRAVIETAWMNTEGYLVVVEPGTPRGFSSILEIRILLLSLGAYLVAPCPHALDCPMKEGDWCHFQSRLERTSIHRRVKGAVLGHEDEKFSYLIVSRERVVLPESRVLRHPLKHTGHLSLTLCNKQGSTEQKIISKKDGEAYRIARKLAWGDSLD